MNSPLLALDSDEYGSGSVHVSGTYTFMNSLQQADLLEDWLEKLTDMHEKVTGKGFLQDLAPSRFKATH